MIKNSYTSFGFVSQWLHWLMAILLTSLFAMGLYMTALDYYDTLYHSLPWWHKSIGLLTLFLLLLRFIWKQINLHPKPLPSHKKWEVSLAFFIHAIFYVLILCIGITGYLISTIKGKGIEFFNAFDVPALISSLEEHRTDFIGEIHKVLAISLAIFVVLHALAALKHHFVDKDHTLKRMITPFTHP
jgi:cytochrome b561